MSPEQLRAVIKEVELWENDFLLRVGVRPGSSPDSETEIELLNHLRSQIQSTYGASFIEMLAHYPQHHPIDALTYHMYASQSEEALQLFEATFTPRVIKAHRFRM